MKFRCERDDVLGAVQFASRAISTRATLPVLAGLRIEALEGGQVRVAATDLELTMETSFQAAVDERCHDRQRYRSGGIGNRAVAGRSECLFGREPADPDRGLMGVEQGRPNA